MAFSGCTVKVAAKKTDQASSHDIRFETLREVTDAEEMERENPSGVSGFSRSREDICGETPEGYPVERYEFSITDFSQCLLRQVHTDMKHRCRR